MLQQAIAMSLNISGSDPAGDTDMSEANEGQDKGEIPF